MTPGPQVGSSGVNGVIIIADDYGPNDDSQNQAYRKPFRTPFLR